MLRVLFIVLSVVSIALAAILGQPFLYLVAAGLLIATAAMVTARYRSRVQVTRPARSSAPPASLPEDDLKSLGIIGIRPKGSEPKPEESAEARDSTARPAPLAVTPTPNEGSVSTGGAAVASTGEADPGTRPTGAKGTTSAAHPVSENPRRKSSPTLSPEEDSGPLFRTAPPLSSDLRSTGAVRKRARTPRIMVEGVSEAFPAEVMLPTLHALRSALDANTVVLLRQQGSALRYYVDAIVSRNAFARNGGRFIAAEPLLVGQRPLDPAIFDCTGPGGFDSHRLGYYHDSIAVHQVAFLPLTIGDGENDPYLLVADSMDDGRLSGETPKRMLREFGRLIQSLVSVPVQVPKVSVPPVTHGESETAGGEETKTRREIIAEEMRKAEKSSMPLALALVYLNDAEAVGAAGEAAVSDAERALESELVARAEDGRVERFGELTYGVFRTVDGDQAASWASQLQIGLSDASDVLSGGVSVGIAMLGDRHDGPDELRADATSALRESFESGECIVLE